MNGKKGFETFDVQGLGMSTARFTNGVERGHVMATILTGIGLGILMGNFAGRYLLQFGDPEAPCGVLAGFAIFEMLLQVNQNSGKTWPDTRLP